MQLRQVSLTGIRLNRFAYRHRICEKISARMACEADCGIRAKGRPQELITAVTEPTGRLVRIVGNPSIVSGWLIMQALSGVFLAV